MDFSVDWIAPTNGHWSRSMDGFVGARVAPNQDGQVWHKDDPVDPSVLFNVVYAVVRGGHGDGAAHGDAMWLSSCNAAVSGVCEDCHVLFASVFHVCFVPVLADFATETEEWTNSGGCCQSQYENVDKLLKILLRAIRVVQRGYLLHTSTKRQFTVNSHILTVTWLDFYCAVSLCTIQKSKWSVWRHCRDWVTWLPKFESTVILSTATGMIELTFEQCENSKIVVCSLSRFSFWKKNFWVMLLERFDKKISADFFCISTKYVRLKFPGLWLSYA